MLARITHYNRAFFSLCKKLLPKGRAKFFVLPVVGAIASIGIFVVVDPAHAQGFLEDIINGMMVFFSWVMFILARLFIGITIFALKFFIEVASYNNFINTPTVKIGWFLVRDVANMFFVVLLLVIAFGTILGLEQYEWKKTLIKLILAAVFINFSNMIAQLIIDVAHVFTITFVNAISATAGGNIIQLFNIDSVYKITGADKLGVGGDLKIEAFAASVASFLLALIMMTTMGAFAIVMAARMVILWVLIILSPLAYIFQVIPQTQKYAQEWWSEFTNHVIVAPVMVFFLWLAFATLNSSVPQLDFGSAGAEATSVIGSGAQVVDAQKKLSISDATTWENLASFMIATVFLIIGLKTVRNLGVVAGGLTSSATGFVKNVATIATGITAARAVGRYAKKKGDENFLQPVREFGDRVKKRVNIARAKVPYLRKIPFIGRMGQLRRQKLNEELDRNSKMTDENIIDTISRKENIGTLDRIGNKFGFGIESWKKKRYKLEAESDIIQAEKAESKRERKAKAAAAFADKANKVIKENGGEKQIAAEKEKALNTFRNAEENKDELAEVGDDWANGKVNADAMKAQAIRTLQEETEEILKEGFEATDDGKKLEAPVAALQTHLQGVTETYKTEFQKYLNGLAAKDLEPIIADDFTDKDKQKIADARKADPTKQDAEIIQTLVRNGQIAVDPESETGKALREEFEQTTTGKGTMAAIAGVNTNLEASRTAKQVALDAYKKENGSKAEEKALAKSGFKERVASAKKKVINEENVKRREQAERAFGETEPAKKLVAKSQENILQLANDIAKGKTKLPGNPDLKTRQGIAERLRMQAKTMGADRQEAEKKRADAQIAGTLQKTEFGQAMMMQQDIAERAEAASKDTAEIFKNEKITKELKHTAELLAQKMKLGGGEAAAAIDKALKKNIYAQSAEQSQILEKTKFDRGRQDTLLKEAANGLAVEKKNNGEATPTQALIPYIKRDIEALSGQEADAAGAYAQKLLAHILYDASAGKMTGEQHAALMTTVMSLAKGGYLDDAVGSVLKNVDKLDTGVITEDSDEGKQTKNLKTIFNQLGILQKDAQGAWIYNRTNAARLQQLVVSGGDATLVSDNKMISDIQQQAQRDGSVKLKNDQKIEAADSYQAMLEKLSAAGMLLSGTVDKFKEKLEASQEFMQEGASYFKREALNTNHPEVGGHFKYDDDLGMYRMSTVKEADDLMAAEQAKRKGKLATQIHGLGTIGLVDGQLKAIDRQAATSILEELKSSQATRQMPQRTVNRMLGYEQNEEMATDAQGNVIVGKSDAYIDKNHGNFDNYMKNIVLPMLLANSESLKYIAREKAQHVDTISSDRGMARISIAGHITGETNSALLKDVIRYATENGRNLLNDADLTTLRRGVEASEKKEATLDKRGRVSKADQEAEEERQSRES
ncbi:MAG: hypothetical protein CO029_01925 [Candidatus Magasanikbacteria bacterium CG_4_9_14_0_2_um_filter_41_10]|nr:MAG: hypothetical protein CO029_01925 [Candidatus Magasanikbacteria bacterium CG_4_9_14_0_2_um_filter_41_10]